MSLLDLDGSTWNDKAKVIVGLTLTILGEFLCDIISWKMTRVYNKYIYTTNYKLRN